MFVRSIRINAFVSLLFVLSLGACSGFGGCGGCGGGPLPAGGVPVSQTVEGGAQIRITPTGFTKLKDIVPALANSALNDGFCVAQQNFGFTALGTFTGIRACTSNVPGCSPGCKIDVTVPPQGITVTPVAGTNRLRVNVAISAAATAQFRAVIASLTVGTCDMTAQSSTLGGSFDIALGVKSNNGELDIRLHAINQFTLGLDFDGCGFASDVLEFFSDVVDSFIGQFIIQLLEPFIDDLLQNFLPSPLGIASMMDVGSLLGGISPGTTGFMEARVVPGGYAEVANDGVNLGVITALNADEDPSPGSRGPGLASEPHLCVPPLPGPDFSNLGLGSVYRSAFNGNTFSLAAAGQFSGSPDPTVPNQNVDIAMGISGTTLDLAGHHLVTSGGLCLGVGSSFISQLNVGTIGILVPSLAELASDEGNDPLLMVTRPQRAIDFTIGDNTTASPALTIHISHLEVDFYAFIYERYTRAFTLDLTMNVGINLDFELQGDTTVIKPSLVGISSSEVTVKVLNSQFVRETPQHLEGVLPSVFDLVAPLLGTLPDIPVPAFGGLQVHPLKVTKVTTSQDHFLALYAQLGSSTMMRTQATFNPAVAEIVDRMDHGIPARQAKSTGRAKLMHIDTPDPKIVRDQLITKDGALPSVSFEVDRYDSEGRELEWSWNLNGGFWREFTTASPLVISDRAFAWQGKYEIGLKSRVKGDFRTTSDVTRTKVTIDSVGPQIFVDKAEWKGSQLRVPAWDVVGGRDFEVAFGEVGMDGPGTKWVPYRDATLARETAQMLARDHNGELVVWARDELGNTTMALVAPFHGQAGESGCSCETTGSPGAGSLLLLGLVGFGLMRRRGGLAMIGRRLVRLASSRTARTIVMFAGVVAISSLVPACSCGKNQGQSCETSADCGPDFCDEGQLPFCIDNTCVCSDDIPPGRIGMYSDVGFGGGQIWVSAYASSHGDLVVANATGGRIPDTQWEWVDGIPDGPVIVPDSEIRGGIEEKGSDVGMYTSIAVGSDGTPMVSYFDRDSASLKFASKAGGVWTTHVVQQGTSQIDPGSGGSLVGMYTSLTLRTDDGRPGIAYLAHVADANVPRAEVRYAAAQTANPTSNADWTFWTVDTAPIPDNPDDIYPLPGGLGLFVDSARNPTNQAPVVVYYDRTNGDLKLARFNPQAGQFATPVLVDGSNGVDAGWSPAVQVDTNGVAHIVYVSATGDDLKYTTDAMDATTETVDDGYRIVGTTVDGLPKPEFHFVGDDANLILIPGGAAAVVYQNATTQELLLAEKGTNNQWVRHSIAGATDPWPGAYGFFASAALGSTEIIMSSWVIDQPNNDNWVEVLARPFSIQ